MAGWPIRRRSEALRRIAGYVLLPLVVALTTPVLLAGIVEARLHPESFSSNAQLTALVQPFVFMEMGGRWLLPLLAAALCIRLAGQRKREAAAGAG